MKTLFFHLCFFFFFIECRHLLMCWLLFSLKTMEWNKWNDWLDAWKTCWISWKDRALDIWDWNKESCTWSWRNISGALSAGCNQRVCVCYYYVLREMEPLARQNSDDEFHEKSDKNFSMCLKERELVNEGYSLDCDTSKNKFAGTGKMHFLI